MRGNDRVNNEKVAIDVDRISKLARLMFTEEEKGCIAKDMEEFLTYADTLSYEEVHCLEGISEGCFREDEIEEFDNIDGMMKNAPCVKGEYIAVPKVME